MGAQEKSLVNANSMQRVKVYRLNDDGKWDDQGTGHVIVDYLERSEELGLFVIDEEDNDTLLMHRICADDIYKKQEDTIISWTDPKYSTELALSFQETTGCSYIWDQIFSVQRNLQFSTINNDTFLSVNGHIKEWPAVELSSLPSILKNVVESGVADQMGLTELILNDKQDFFRKLMGLFRICEDLKNLDHLHMIFKIVWGIILLNSPQIFEKLLSDEFFIDVIGCLEYDPEVPTQHHRNFLKEHAIFREAIPIKDPLVLSKIHQTYKIGYLKDVVLAGVLDESTVANLNSMVNTNNALVVSLLKEDNSFIQELFAILRTPTSSMESKKKLVHFLHEFCGLSKSLQMVHQLRLFRDLMNEGIFDIIVDALQSPDKKLVLTGTDILILFLNQDPNLLRSYVVQQEGIHLFGLLVKGMMTDFGDDMHCQFLEILRCLLDSYTLSGQQRDSIVEVFYENHFAQLIDAITRSCPSGGTSYSLEEVESSVRSVGNLNNMKSEILSNICELLCFCVLHHPFRIKCNFLVNNVVGKVLLLTQRKEKYLVVAAVRFVRTILSRHDDHLVNHFVKSNLLKPVVGAFVAHGNRYNLLNSAVLELFEYIRKENLNALVIYIIDSFWSELVPFEYLAPIQSFKVKYEQCLEDCGPKGTVDTSESRKRIDDRALEKEEEDYFKEDSDEDDITSHSDTRPQRLQTQPALSNGSAACSQSFSSRSGRLVDYEDNEDDFEYRPPPKKQTSVTDEDDGTMDTLRLKRKIGSKQMELETSKKQHLGKSSRSKDNMFTSLSATFSRATLPKKKSVSSTQSNLCTPDGNCEQSNEGKAPAICRSSSDSTSITEENHREKEPPTSINCSNVLNNSTDNKQLNGDDHPLIPPQSSSEMTSNGVRSEPRTSRLGYRHSGISSAATTRNVKGQSDCFPFGFHGCFEPRTAFSSYICLNGLPLSNF